MIRAVMIGEAMLELRPAGPGLLAHRFAGDAYNTAVHVKRALGDKARVSFLTAVGDDGPSADLIGDMAAEGLDRSLAFGVPGGRIGVYLVSVDARGERSFDYWREASAARTWFAGLEAHGGAAALAEADLVYLSGVSLAILGDADRAKALRLLQDLKGRVRHIAFDPNVRPRLWSDAAAAQAAIEAAAACADILLPSLEDAKLIWGPADPDAQLSRWAALGPRELAMTCGPAGAVIATADGRLELAAPVVQALDTSGAGDAFNGAYLAARLDRASPTDAAIAGLALAAEVVMQPGALPRGGLSRPLGEDVRVPRPPARPAPPAGFR